MNNPIIHVLVVPTTFLPSLRNLRSSNAAIAKNVSSNYTTSLAFAHLKELPFTFLCGFTSPAATSDVYEPSLSFSMHTLYTDSSFHDATDSSSPSMTSAWLALDDDGFILESSFISLSFCLLSALRSEIYAIIDWLCPQCNSSAPENLNHLWACSYILSDLNPCLTYQSEIAKFQDICLVSFLNLKSLPTSFQDEFFALNCWNFTTPFPFCLWLTRRLLPTHLTIFLLNYFSLSVVYQIISPFLNDFQVALYGEIWLYQNILFHAWEEF
ncbi:hypothetical protein RhiirA5_421481 [Rhizophagus irregularis]|uniref:Uncharacterized protein n=1 Tax=Rhizophagus irregularis TaxID=588596 RepID=A0A2N0PDU4_9GLOM|nr:hypothetical protein RhiirA5_421481 [Rhizophagus irregularis]